MAHYAYVIAGGGAAAAYAARELVARGARPGEVALVSEESVLPYHRYPLSKAYLTQRVPLDVFLVNRPYFYEDSGIQTRLGVRISALDTERATLRLEQEEIIAYENLLIATGAKPIKFDCEGAGSPDLFYLRDINDAQSIRTRAETSETAVLIGGGFTGLELGASLCRIGLKVTLVYMEDRLMPFLFTERMHEFFAHLYEEHGVTLVPSQTVHRFVDAGDGRIEVHLESGDVVKGDFAVAGIGVEPAVDIARGTPIHLDNGIYVNEFLETGAPGVWAAGDVANYADLVYGRRRRGEHMQKARDQGISAARNMTGLRQEYRGVPYCFSEFFEYKWEFWGDQSDCDEVLYVGDLEHGTFSTWWTCHDIVRAAFAMGRVDEERTRARLCVQEQREIPRDIRQRAHVYLETGAGT